MTEVPSRVTDSDATPKGAISCERRIGPLGILVILFYVKCCDFDLTFGIYITHRLWGWPRESFEFWTAIRTGYAKQRKCCIGGIWVSPAYSLPPLPLGNP